ncbi:MAG: macro domain-containing protein [Eubacteriales bacterium]|nr:macro domain-containing protein [Eubacteriales bacterium]
MLLSVIDNTEGGALNLIQGDIVTMDVQAIVNPSNNMLTAAPDDDSINGLIHRAAGPGLDAECRTLHGIATGEAKITDGYDLQAEYVIHTAGPIYSGKPSDEEELAECYENALDLARTHGITSIALPCISTGAFGYPAEDAADIAIPTVLEWISDNDDYDLNVTFCVHDEDTYDMYKGFLDQIFDSSDTDEQ